MVNKFLFFLLISLSGVALSSPQPIDSQLLLERAFKRDLIIGVKTACIIGITPATLKTIKENLTIHALFKHLIKQYIKPPCIPPLAVKGKK
jgi:hypothetical protein